MYIYIHTHTHTFPGDIAHADVFVCLYVFNISMHVCEYERESVCASACLRVCANICVYIYVFACAYM